MADDILAALIELTDLMQGVIDGDYIPDSFTLQPAHAALVKAGAFVLCDKDGGPCFLPECREHGCMVTAQPSAPSPLPREDNSSVRNREGETGNG